MNAPTEFTKQLEQTFQGRLRIRWSSKRREFHIEQKVGRMAPAPQRISEADDDMIRARDGYHFVMSIREGDRMPCPECGFEIKVPVMDTADIRCTYCEMTGKQTRVVAGFWPLNERLIEHLRKIDPLRGGQKELADAADRYNELLVQAAENQISNDGYAALEERYNRLVGIPQTGYTGKVFTG